MGIHRGRLPHFMVCKALWLHLNECVWSRDDGHLRDYHLGHTPASTSIRVRKNLASTHDGMHWQLSCPWQSHLRELLQEIEARHHSSSVGTWATDKWHYRCEACATSSPSHCQQQRSPPAPTSFLFLLMFFCFISSCLSVLINGGIQRGSPRQGPYGFCFRRVDITQRRATSVVLLLCHVRKDGPRGGIHLCCLCEIKIVVLRTINMIASPRHCVPLTDPDACYSKFDTIYIV